MIYFSEYRYIAHARELFGYDGLMTLYPDMKAGIYTCFNGPGGEPAFICNQLLHYFLSDLVLQLQPWLDTETICTFPEPWKSRDSYYPYRIHTEIIKILPFWRLCYVILNSNVKKMRRKNAVDKSL